MARPIPLFTLPATDQVAREDFTRTGCRPVRAVRRAQALLALAAGQSQQQAATTAGLRWQTVSQVRRRFKGTQRAALTALACTSPPTGHGR